MSTPSSNDDGHHKFLYDLTLLKTNLFVHCQLAESRRAAKGCGGNFKWNSLTTPPHGVHPSRDADRVGHARPRVLPRCFSATPCTIYAHAILLLYFCSLVASRKQSAIIKVFSTISRPTLMLKRQWNSQRSMTTAGLNDDDDAGSIKPTLVRFRKDWYTPRTSKCTACVLRSRRFIKNSIITVPCGSCNPSSCRCSMRCTPVYAGSTRWW